MSCGGQEQWNDWNVVDDCYKLGTTSSVAKLIQKRYLASSTAAGSELWITGGFDDSVFPNELQSTEFVDPSSGTVRQGPDLPKASNAHCTVMMDSGTGMVIAGSGQCPQQLNNREAIQLT